MRGTEINDRQMESACEFLALTAQQPLPAHDDDVVGIKFSTMVRLMAWYGAVRYQAGTQGIGRVDDPNGYREADLALERLCQ